MNFKDIYKEANDEIKGDREILKSVLDGSFTPKKKKSPVKIVYAFGSLAAAAAILFAVTYMPDFNKTPDEKAPPLTVSIRTNEGEKKIKEADSVADKKSETEKEKTAPVKENVRSYEKKETGQEVKAEAKAAPVPEETEKAAAPAPEEAENAAAPGVTYNMAESEPVSGDISNVKEKDSGITYFAEAGLTDENKENGKEVGDMVTRSVSGGAAVTSGGGGAANSVSVPSEIPVDEFFTVIGFDEEKLSLPGFRLKMPETADMTADNEGNILSLSAEFYLESDASHISVTLSKGGTVTEKTVTVFDGGVSAYADNGRVSAYISALGTDETTVSGYMDKIMKEE
mgnify:FL=1